MQTCTYSFDQHKGQAVFATANRCAHHPGHHGFQAVLCVVLHTVHRNFLKEQLLVNAFCVFQAFYRSHVSYNFHAQGVTLKSKALATKCVFQN